MAYDVADRYVVMFGGRCNIPGYVSNQTWAFAAGAWKNITSSRAPSARAYASMTYDPQVGAILLFGGQPWRGPPQLGDTWKFLNGSWTNITPKTGSPPARYLAQMTFDSRDGYALLFGGSAFNATSHTYPVFNDTWSYVRGGWLQLHPAVSPAAIWGPALTFDGRNHRVLLYEASSSHRNYTWLFGRGNWTRVNTVGEPNQFTGEELAYDPSNGFTLLFGGYGAQTRCVNKIVCHETWAYFNGNWTYPANSHSPGLRWDVAMAYDAGDAYVLMFGGEARSIPGFYSETYVYG